ncbi:Transcriptional regulator, ArsR family [Streptococcus infantarius subsp. infantarius]|uniref:ArsR/SmtB family transcription factor n=1 Tax=Streptococcus TaxID=1301 RepID=UPI000ED57C18|nr:MULTISPECIES: metalloregulator ArsR/SmtB family transcription factor [Streptococcus]MBT0896576.1 winged helix-turn-helix domain-containing protein [Streptococcus infantarius subsp. infantarius]MBT0900909.1 winged helix-turn-helix domain-containing protein [Streptococcus infantarius subsp. infantarius]MBT0904069.1 winged helix-turn-helix domain-containing protein [Streptococcus infantarius subsp. infantarius]MBT0917982.1 winged helix-turn-helix domain-containing protein [Streptococcus infanta
MTIEQYSNYNDEDLIKIFKALADPVRLNILRILSKRESELGCGEVGELLDMSKSAVSYHFKTLREAGLTITRKAGQNKFVRLNHETLEKYSLTNLINNL